VKNLEIYAYKNEGEINLLNLMFLKDKLDGIKIIYYNYLLEKVTPFQIKEEIKSQIIKKYHECEPTIDLNNIYNNLITNINKANLELF